MASLPPWIFNSGNREFLELVQAIRQVVTANWRSTPNLGSYDPTSSCTAASNVLYYTSSIYNRIAIGRLSLASYPGEYLRYIEVEFGVSQR